MLLRSVHKEKTVLSLQVALSVTTTKNDIICSRNVIMELIVLFVKRVIDWGIDRGIILVIR